MQVIVHAQDRSGRGDGYYTKPTVEEALAIFFKEGQECVFADPDGDEILSEADAKAAFTQNREVTFYNDNGEKMVITTDWSNSSR